MAEAIPYGDVRGLQLLLQVFCDKYNASIVGVHTINEGRGNEVAFEFDDGLGLYTLEGVIKSLYDSGFSYDPSMLH